MCVTVSVTIPPGCQLVKYIVAIMKLFAYNDNTHKISPPKGTLAQLFPINLGHFYVEAVLFSVVVQSQVCSNNSRLVPVRNNLVPAVLILN